MRKKRNRSPDFLIRNILAQRIFPELPVPSEHRLVAHTAPNNPEPLVIRLGRRLMRKDLRIRIKPARIPIRDRRIRIAMAARAIPLEQLHSRPQVFFGRRTRIRQVRR